MNMWMVIVVGIFACSVNCSTETTEAPLESRTTTVAPSIGTTDIVDQTTETEQETTDSPVFEEQQQVPPVYYFFTSGEYADSSEDDIRSRNPRHTRRQFNLKKDLVLDTPPGYHYVFQPNPLDIAYSKLYSNFLLPMSTLPQKFVATMFRPRLALKYSPHDGRSYHDLHPGDYNRHEGSKAAIKVVPPPSRFNAHQKPTQIITGKPYQYTWKPMPEVATTHSPLYTTTRTPDFKPSIFTGYTKTYGSSLNVPLTDSSYNLQAGLSFYPSDDLLGTPQPQVHPSLQYVPVPMTSNDYRAYIEKLSAAYHTPHEHSLSQLYSDPSSLLHKDSEYLLASPSQVYTRKTKSSKKKKKQSTTTTTTTPPPPVQDVLDFASLLQLMSAKPKSNKKGEDESSEEIPPTKLSRRRMKIEEPRKSVVKKVSGPVHVLVPFPAFKPMSVEDESSEEKPMSEEVYSSEEQSLEAYKPIPIVPTKRSKVVTSRPYVLPVSFMKKSLAPVNDTDNSKDKSKGFVRIEYNMGGSSVSHVYPIPSTV